MKICSGFTLHGNKQTYLNPWNQSTIQASVSCMFSWIKSIIPYPGVENLLTVKATGSPQPFKIAGRTRTDFCTAHYFKVSTNWFHPPPVLSFFKCWGDKSLWGNIGRLKIEPQINGLSNCFLNKNLWGHVKALDIKHKLILALLGQYLLLWRSLITISWYFKHFMSAVVHATAFSIFLQYNPHDFPGHSSSVLFKAWSTDWQHQCQLIRLSEMQTPGSCPRPTESDYFKKVPR